MIPEHLNFGGGVSQTMINPVVLLVALLAGVSICFLSRNKAIIPFITAAILIPDNQIVLIGPAHFSMLRLLVTFGFVRLVWKKATSKSRIFTGGMDGIDVAVMLFAVFTALDGILLWKETGAVVYQLGNLYSTLGIYLLLRSLVCDLEDVKRLLRTLACVAAVVAAIMICEQLTGKNPYYAALGGARASAYESVMLRDNHLRATGCFAHPILAGTFGGITLPLFMGLWWVDKKDRKYAALGAAAALVMPFAASSSTALFGFVGGLIGLALWPLRRRMRIIRWGIVVVLVSLHLAMKAPVWHLISRVDLSGGSSSYHRYELVNNCILHFRDWWLVGTKDYASWGWDMWDLSNQYVGTADTAGLIPLLSFLAMIVFGFKYLGIARRTAKADRKQELFIWALGASLFANVVAFFGIGYFDQTIVAWYALLAMIHAAATSVRKARRERANQEPKDQGSAPSLDRDQAEVEIPSLVSESRLIALGFPRGNYQ